MKKTSTSAKIYLRGSKTYIKRTIYANGDRRFVIWEGDFIEVKNPNGDVTSGWFSVEMY